MNAMYVFSLTLMIGLFLAMLFLNIYFRVKVFKAYKILVQNRVEFDMGHVFNSKKMKDEVLSKYPEHTDAIQSFLRHMRYSIRMATVLIMMITLIGALMLYFKE
jgi:hypothetical protein